MKPPSNHRLASKRRDLSARRNLAAAKGEADPLAAQRVTLHAKRAQFFLDHGFPVPDIYKPEATPPNKEIEPIRDHPKGWRIGDMVAKVAQPIARGIDYMFGTNLENCTGCRQRRTNLNRIGAPKSDTPSRLHE